MIKKKYIRKREEHMAEETPTQEQRRVQATHVVFDKYQQNPDTSVYAKRFTHLQNKD